MALIQEMVFLGTCVFPHSLGSRTRRKGNDCIGGTHKVDGMMLGSRSWVSMTVMVEVSTVVPPAKYMNLGPKMRSRELYSISSCISSSGSP